MMTQKHSEHFFTDARNFWWNADFLKWMAQRWNLSGVRQILDVGCGVGHWTKAVLQNLPSDARVTGVDREAGWVSQARAEFVVQKDRVSFIEASAEHLPFPDHSFDLVTCQTLLIHVLDPRQVILEMLRVLKPGGLIVAAEPSNLAQTKTSVQTTVEEAMELHRILLVCERGKIALGEGDNSVGDLLPGIFSELGIQNIQVYLSDRASALYPPYIAPGQSEAIADELRDVEAGYFLFGREDTRRFFLAGGGSEDEFGRLYATGLRYQAQVKEAIKQGTFHCGRGHVTYLVSGRKG
ncbi:methyltransferase domain-containing protein [Bdellovibrionota bacterium FG-1]